MNSSQYVVDLNCDMGESFGAYTMGNDAAIFPYITSANIACGFHAGDAASMKQSVRLALKHQVAIGAHPGLPDLQGFGRRALAISAEEAYDMVVYQIGALQGFVQSEGGILKHVKPHGALYNMAASNTLLAEAIAKAVYNVNPMLLLYGLSGSALTHAGEQIGLSVVHEVFADRTYQHDGSLTSRQLPNAMIQKKEDAVKQALGMVQQGLVRSTAGTDIGIKADTICIHGDGEHAVTFAINIYNTFKAAKIILQAP